MEAAINILLLKDYFRQVELEPIKRLNVSLLHAQYHNRWYFIELLNV